MNENRLFGDVLNEELRSVDLRRARARYGPKAVPDDAFDRERLRDDLPGATKGEPMSEEQVDQARAVLDGQLRKDALDRDLVGVAFSGGGIRSATFALGVTQALARMDLLRRVDYLSTVSGGGYIGSWLAAWIWREGIEDAPSPGAPVEPVPAPAARPKDAVRNVEEQLTPSRLSQADVVRPPLSPGAVVDEEPEAIRHLRAFSNYLTPRPGLFTTDTLTLLSIYARNFLLNQLILLPFTVALVLLAWLVVLAFGRHTTWNGDYIGTAFVLILLSSFIVMGLELSKLYQGRTTFSKPPPGGGQDAPARSLDSRAFHRLVIWPSVVAAVMATWLFGVSEAGKPPEKYFHWRAVAWVINTLQKDVGFLKDWKVDGTSNGTQALAFFFGFGLLHFLAHCVGMVYGLFRDRGRLTAEEWPARRERDLAVLGASFVSGALGGVLLYLTMTHFLIPSYNAPGRLATFGPPLMLLIVTVAAVSEVGLLGRYLQEDEREWWARVSAFMLMHALAWVVVFGAIVYVPRAILVLDEQARRVLTPGLVLGWLATSLGGAMAGRARQTGGGGGGWVAGLLVKVAPPVFLLGLLSLISWVLWYEIHPANQPEFWFTEAAYRGTAHGPTVAMVCAACVAVGYAMNRVLNVNVFSLNAMYANRLTRCYLGASRRKEEWKTTWKHGVWHPGLGGAPTGAGGKERTGQPITGFDFHDDLPLRELRVGPGGKGGAAYWGPFRLLNTAMNLVAGRDLAWQDRRAESFVLTPLYCGSRGTGYRKLDEKSDEILTLGRAMAISGAAADPSLGARQSPALTALMTIFNARLGWWLQNPKVPGPWAAKSPRFGGLLWYELAGQTDENRKHVHLSDGGHFENLGVYELVRRRCRYIVACDAGQDRKSIYDDLGTLARLCRSDFGVRIDIDTAPIDPDPQARHSRWHCAIGQIHYEDVDEGEIPGILVYLKASLTGDEPSDVRNYAATNPDFPHQTTADQFFDEAQFESYRALGHHVASTVFNAAVYDAGFENTMAGEKPDPDWDHDRCLQEASKACKRENRELFARLRARWFPAPAEIETTYQETAAAFGILQGVMRSDGSLRRFSLDMHPELGPPPPADLPKAAAGRRNRSGRRRRAAAPPAAAAKAAARAARAGRRSAELHMTNQVVQVMEKAWMGVRLEGYPEHPINRGWMNALRRVARSATLRRNWPIVRGGFDLEFVQFCERELSLPDGSPTLFRLSKQGARYEMSANGVTRPAGRAVRVLGREFSREWPDLNRLGSMIADAQSLTLSDGQPAAWVVCSTRPGDTPGTVLPTFPLGIILLRKRGGGRPGDPGELELTVWLRGPYRNMGVSRNCLAGTPDELGLFDEILHDDTLRASGRENLVARYPATDPSTRVIEKKLWLNFHYSYEFRVTGKVDVESGDELVMRRRLARPPAAAGNAAEARPAQTDPSKGGAPPDVTPVRPPE